MSAPIVVFAAHKGGVGKTTTTVNTGRAVCAREWVEPSIPTRAPRVLLVDLDGQAHVASMLDVARASPTLEDVLLEQPGVPAVDAVRPSYVPGLDVLPAGEGLYDADIVLARRVAREQLVARALAPLRDAYDLILVDTPPQRGLLTLAALVAADYVVPIVSAHHLALEGVLGLRRTLRLLGEEVGRTPHLAGYLLTQVPHNESGARRVVADMRAEFGAEVFATAIRRNAKVAEAPQYARAVADFAPDSAGARDYAAFATELLDRVGLSEHVPPVEAATADAES